MTASYQIELLVVGRKKDKGFSDSRVGAFDGQQFEFDRSIDPKIFDTLTEATTAARQQADRLKENPDWVGDAEIVIIAEFATEFDEDGTPKVWDFETTETIKLGHHA